MSSIQIFNSPLNIIAINQLANVDDETGPKGNSYTLTENSGDIPNSSTVPSIYSGYSGDFEKDNTQELFIADAIASGLDINRADAML